MQGLGPLQKGSEKSGPWQGPGRSGRGLSLSPLTPRMRARLMEPYPECLASSSVLQPGGLGNKAAAWKKTVQASVTSAMSGRRRHVSVAKEHEVEGEGDGHACGKVEING